MTNLEFLRHRLLKGLLEPNKFKFSSIEELEGSQWCSEFIRYMKNRMIMGAFRYGKLSVQKRSLVKYDNIASIRTKLKLYEQTGNTEFLVDCGNLCMIEYVVGDHPNKHFKPIDDSPHAELKS